jgi:hypothetical protein
MSWDKTKFRRFSMVLGLLAGGAFALAIADDHGGGSSGSGGGGHDDGAKSTQLVDDHGGASSNKGSSSGGQTAGAPKNTQGPDDHGGVIDNTGNSDEVKGEAQGLLQEFEAHLKVVFEDRGNQSRFKIEVEDVNLPVGTILNACLNGNLVGSLVLNGSHEAELELIAAIGGVPVSIKTGDVVEVRQDVCSSASAPLLSVTIGGVTTPPPTQAVAPVRLQGKTEALVAGFAAELSAKAETRSDRMRFGAEVENVNLPLGTSLNVCRAGLSLGSIVLDSFHSGELNLDSRKGDAVPTFVAGDVIAVRQDGCAAATPPLLAATLQAP